MGIFLLLAIVVIGVFLGIAGTLSSSKVSKGDKNATIYTYVRRAGIMTSSEVSFFKRLEHVVSGKYLIFPQIDLSSLATNKTVGRYSKVGFQRINRRSVDYVLVDPQTLEAVYAVELDDRTHDTQRARAVDAVKTGILEEIGIPLVRFRDVYRLSDDDIIRSFEAAHISSRE